ncbi:MAG: tetratricopeptide repeat protein [Myxococcaceae bacterium]|nr:tetratricopeptide repeat protein [Myxococcaceae bacterium]
MRALREENARLEAKLQRVEQQKVMAQAAPAGQQAAVVASAKGEPRPAAEVKSTAEVPELTVVKLKPKKEAAPKLRTEVEVLEPSADVLAAMKKIEAEDRGVPSEPEEIDAAQGDELFQKGLEALKTGNVSGAVEQLSKFASAAPRHAKADNALYFSGVGKMGLNDYEDAARTFEEVASRYPAGDAVQDSMLKLAECRMKLNRPKEARAVYEKIVSRFPGTVAASQAQGRLTQLR